MQQITLKKSTIAAMNQAFKTYCKFIDQMELAGVNVQGVLKDINGYLLMLFCRQIIDHSGYDLSAGESIQKIMQLQYDFTRLDDD